jgi:hypothetical protein
LVEQMELSETVQDCGIDCARRGVMG